MIKNLYINKAFVSNETTSSEIYEIITENIISENIISETKNSINYQQDVYYPRVDGSATNITLI